MSSTTTLDRGSDVAVVEATAMHLTAPRADEPDSFVLHAPLELLARAALLPHASPDVRARAHDRIASIARRFDDFGPAAAEVDDPGGFATPADATAALVEALTTGDLDGAAGAGRFLGRTLDADDLAAAVARTIAPSLAAAAHGPIFLHRLPRSMPRSTVAGAMFGTLAREIARHPDWALDWFEGHGGATAAPASVDLVSALAAIPVIGSPGSDFIHPLMQQAQDSGLAAGVVGPAVDGRTNLHDATTAILRVATASMLLDDPDHAPYGWSHCLTIPQGVLTAARRVDDPTDMVRIAATHVVGFRAALARAPLGELRVDGRALGSDGLVTGLAPPSARELQDVVDHAVTHEDAHLVKYVVSCLDAARTDPAGAAQHLRAAQHLSRWWHAHDGLG